MSSIERAMDKIVAGTAPASDDIVPVSTANATPVSSETTTAPPAAPPRPAATPADVAPVITSPPRGSEGPASAPAEAEPTFSNNNFINIDFARLAAGGVVSP